jgi:hypothetical protein
MQNQPPEQPLNKSYEEFTFTNGPRRGDREKDREREREKRAARIVEAKLRPESRATPAVPPQAGNVSTSQAFPRAPCQPQTLINSCTRGCNTRRGERANRTVTNTWTHRF